jgi:hypothetical protein
VTSINRRLALGRWGLFAVAAITLGTLAFQVLLTRILSATVWYHFAFMAVSVAMFGMTAGALFVQFRAAAFDADLRGALVRHSLGTALAMPPALLVHLAVPIVEDASAASLFGIVLTFVVFATPFFFSGVVVCLVLTRFPRQVGRIYAADLIGAAVGAVAVVGLLQVVDGLTAVLATSVAASLAALGFAVEEGGVGRVRLRFSAGFAFVAVALFTVHAWMASEGRPFLRILWVKGELEPPPLYEVWNAYSRITVGDFGGEGPSAPFGWGLSHACPEARPIEQLALRIDGMAGTVLTRFADDPAPLRYLRCDVTNVAHPLRPGARTLVVGAGGGRDVLSAIAFEQPEIVAVELNRAILETVNGRYGDFTGHLDRLPGVTFIEDEARSWLERSRDSFDLIQISLIDTWAATSAGAFVLAENGLYTTEAWEVFLERLSPRGILTVSRWYVRERPAEMIRAVALARATLLAAGVDEPRRHLALVAHRRHATAGTPDGVGTLLMSAAPLDARDVATLEELASRYDFALALTPTAGDDAAVVAVADGRPPPRSSTSRSLDFSPPTDDRPFFFQMLRFRDVLHGGLADDVSTNANIKAVGTLAVLLGIVVALAAVTLILPMAVALRRSGGFADARAAAPLLVYFVGIGAGFMLVELSQMQRLILFLGNPVFGLTVVLATLLLAGGVGSSLSRGAIGTGSRSRALLVFAVAPAVLVLFGLTTPAILETFRAGVTALRVLVAAATLVPIGVALGLAFPLGLTVAARQGKAALLPWFWAVNGACSVCAAVAASVISFGAGIAMTFWVGAACYGLAWLALARATRPAPGSEPAGGGVTTPVGR